VTEQTAAASAEAANTETPAAITADDLNLIDPKLADEAKDRSDLWAELEAAEKPAAEPGKAQEAQEPASATAEPGGAETASAKPGEADKPDIWATATPEQKAAFEAAQQKARSGSGRISALQRKLNSLTAAQPQASRDPKETREAIAGIEKDYPEFAPALGAIKDEVDEIRKTEKGRIDAEREAATKEFNELVEAETHMVLARHPDYETVLKQNGKAFIAWVEDQPRRIREAAYRNDEFIRDSDGAIEVIEGFKKHLGLSKAEPAPQPAPAAAQPSPQPPLNDKRQRQIAGSSAPRSSGGPAAVTGLPTSGDRSAFWKAFEAMDQAKTGRA
jgi:hypothetical protein